MLVEDETGDVARMTREALAADKVGLTADALERFVGPAAEAIERGHVCECRVLGFDDLPQLRAGQDELGRPRLVGVERLLLVADFPVIERQPEVEAALQRLAAHPLKWTLVDAPPAGNQLTIETLAEAAGKGEEINAAAEELTARMRMHNADVRTEIVTRLEAVHNVSIRRRVDLGETVLHRYDPRTRVLEINRHLSGGQQVFKMAAELAYLECGREIDALVDRYRGHTGTRSATIWPAASATPTSSSSPAGPTPSAW